jgi:hypothetical protein
MADFCIAFLHWLKRITLSFRISSAGLSSSFSLYKLLGYKRKEGRQKEGTRLNLKNYNGNNQCVGDILMLIENIK